MPTTIPTNVAAFTAWELAVAAGGDLLRLPDEQAHIVGIVTDSRALQPGNGFVAIRGATFDGHDFLRAAVDRGATAVVVERGRDVPEGAMAIIEVDDALAALGRIARTHVRRWRTATRGRGRIAALTGSAGKTTTKELAHVVLAGMGSCHATTGNLNNRVGVPAVALGLLDQSFAVFELGMSVPGEIAVLANIVEADVAALLNVGVAHAEGFGGSRAAIAREKGAIFEALAPGGTAVVNVDDEAARAQILRTGAHTVGFGMSPRSDVRLVHRVASEGGGSRITVNRRGETFDVVLAVAGEAVALDLVAAIAIADATVGHPVPAGVIAETALAWEPPPGRAVSLKLEGDLEIVDDSYNANPASMRAALALLAELGEAGARRTVAVLGEMRELGPLAAQEHESLGAELARRGVGLVIGCGGAMDAALRRAAKAGVDVRYAPDARSAGNIVAEESAAGDVILFKGSRGVAVERALAVLVARYPVRVAGKRGGS